MGLLKSTYWEVLEEVDDPSELTNIEIGKD